MNLIDTYPLFKKVAILIKNTYTAGSIVEIGAGEHSTHIFLEWATEYNIKMYSVDKIAHRLTRAQNNLLINIHSTGEKFLEEFNDTIFFCYMDNLDWLNYWDYPGQSFYADCTKEKSEQVHLEQSKLLVEKLDPKGYILFDDTGIESKIEHPPEYIMEHLNNIKFYGKGAKAIPFLIEKGMKIIGYSANRHHGGFDGEHDQILLGKY